MAIAACRAAAACSDCALPACEVGVAAWFVVGAAGVDGEEEDDCGWTISVAAKSKNGIGEIIECKEYTPYWSQTHSSAGREQTRKCGRPSRQGPSGRKRRGKAVVRRTRGRRDKGMADDLTAVRAKVQRSTRTAEKRY